MKGSEAIHQEIIDTGRQMLARGLAWGCSGNISRRVSSDSFLISASGTSLGALTVQDLAECSTSGVTCSGPTPSRETGLHRAIYRLRPDVQAVIHSSPFHTTLLACSLTPPRTDLFPEAMAYLGSIASVPYPHPGSPALADAVAAQAIESDVLMLENHGTVVQGQSLHEALLRLETLEFLCRMEIMGRTSDLSLRHLGDEASQAFVAEYQAQPAPGQEVNASCK